VKRCAVAVLLILAVTGGLAAQEAQSSGSNQNGSVKSLNFYKIQFVLREVQDKKVLNSRSYTMVLEDHKQGSTKIGNRVPVPTGASQFQYIDVGINITANVHGEGPLVQLDSAIEVSSFALPEQEKTASAAGGAPIVRQIHANLSPVLHAGEQSVIGIITDATSTREYEIAATVTKMK
jgi:hypothetical protein